MILLKIFVLLTVVALTSGLEDAASYVEDSSTSLKEENVTTSSTSGFDFDTLVRILSALLSLII